MKRLKETIERNATGKKVLLLFVVTNLVYVYMLSVTIPKIMVFSKGAKILDMLPTGYSLTYVNTLFESLGQQGRNVYLYQQIPIDLVYPFLFAISYCILLAYFLKRIDKLNSHLFYFCLLPIITAASDYCENIGIITLLGNYPDITRSSVGITAIFSIIKSITTTIYFIVLLITTAVFVYRSIKNKQRDRNRT